MRLRSLKAKLHQLGWEADVDGLEVFVVIHGSRRPIVDVRLEEEPLTVAEAAQNKPKKKRVVLV